MGSHLELAGADLERIRRKELRELKEAPEILEQLERRRVEFEN